MRLEMRVTAGILLAIILLATAVPHRDDDTLFDGAEILAAPQEIYVTHCGRLPAGVTHLHRDHLREVEPCIACFLQHLRVTTSMFHIGTPQVLKHALTVTARVAHSHSLRLRKSSRAPPIFAS